MELSIEFIIGSSITIGLFLLGHAFILFRWGSAMQSSIKQLEALLTNTSEEIKLLREISMGQERRLSTLEGAVFKAVNE